MSLETLMSRCAASTRAQWAISSSKVMVTFFMDTTIVLHEICVNRRSGGPCDLSFTVAEGQLFGFVGPNGAGKTTAMRIILGVLEPDAGQVRWRGQPMTGDLRRQIGYLPEDHGQTFLNSAQALAPVEGVRRQLGGMSGISAHPLAAAWRRR